MLDRGTLPSRPELLAFCGHELAVPTGAIWRGVQAGDSVAFTRMVDIYVPRLDHYLHAGLGIPYPNARDAVMADAIARLAALDRVDRCELRLYQAARDGAGAAGLVPRHSPMHPSGPKQLELGLRLLKGEVQSAGARARGQIGGQGTATQHVLAFAVAVIGAASAAPVWFVEPRFLERAARARVVYEIIIDATSPLAPPPLTPNEVQVHSGEIEQAFDRVWLLLPPEVKEARTLWGLNLSVSDIAEILRIPVAAADAELLQLLVLTTAFNTLVGRRAEAGAPELGMLSAIGLSAEEPR